jgi:biopolymer transport protein ExbB/TolQ
MPLALGLAVGVPCYVGYNHLVTVVGDIVLDMEKTSLDALRMVSEMEKLGRRKKKADDASATPTEDADLFKQP